MGILMRERRGSAMDIVTWRVMCCLVHQTNRTTAHTPCFLGSMPRDWGSRQRSDKGSSPTGYSKSRLDSTLQSTGTCRLRNRLYRVMQRTQKYRKPGLTQCCCTPSRC